MISTLRLPPAPALGNVPEFSVSELSFALKRAIETAFPRVRVRGEISQPSFPRSGHCYFRLKDENAVIDGVFWKGTIPRLGIRIEEGLEVIATGKITTYAGSSSYQIIIDRLELAGVGALLALLEDRRKKLQAEGLFDAGAQARAALPAAGDRRRDLADRRGDPRHPAPPRRSLPLPRAGLAGCRCRARRRRARWPRPSPASTRLAEDGRCRGPTC